MQHILIIGAGVSATALALRLAATDVGEKTQSELTITLVDKSRGVGGRMATRRRDGFAFDHGAQFFTARSAEFRALIEAEMARGTVAEWRPRLTTLEKQRPAYKREWFEPHYVAAPSMTALCKSALGQLSERGAAELRLGAQVTSLERSDGAAGARWRAMCGDEPLGSYDFVVSAAPCRQTELLFAGTGFAGTEAMARASHLPCFSLMVGLERMPELNFDLAVVKQSPIALIVANDSKPGRIGRGSLLVHSDNEWARDHLEDDLASVQAHLLGELSALVPIEAEALSHVDLHRWRFAKTELAADDDFLLDAPNALAACGDWCLGGRVEDAFLSGYRLGDALRQHLAAGRGIIG